MNIPSPETRINPRDKICLLGSCFAGYMGNRMKRAGLDVSVNPFGVLYNPLSIETVCALLAGKIVLSDDCFVEADSMWHCWWVDGSFSAAEREACRAGIEMTVREQAERLKQLDCLFLTLGTNRYYEIPSLRMVAGNCHKQPSSMFVERCSDVDQTTEALEQALTALWRVRPSLRVVFTVSPYRYAKYGFHESRLAKSVLLLAVDNLCRRYDLCSYFPAYEILLDELRDYRFYAEDMLHPSDVAVSYIWERFSEVYFSPSTQMFVQEREAVARALEHRLLHPESEAARTFQANTMRKIEQFNRKYKTAEFMAEYERLQTLLATP